MNNYTKLRLCFSLFFLMCIIMPVLSYNLKPLISTKKLSNNSVISLMQDKEGLLWIGTCDGVNTYDGNSIDIYNPPKSDFLLSGMLIDKMLEGQGKTLWIQTYYGINRVDIKREKANIFTEFNKQILTCIDTYKNLYILKNDNNLYWFNEKIQTFEIVESSCLNFKQTLKISVKNSYLYLFFKDGSIKRYLIDLTNRLLHSEEVHKHCNAIQQVIINEDTTYIIDDKDTLYQFDYKSETLIEIANINHLTEGKGQISSIIQFNDAYFISFTINGLYKLTIENGLNKIERIPIDSGIFCLMKDRYQDMFWIGTDGKGVYSYSNSEFSIRSTILDNTYLKMNRPIRSIYWDKNKTLWLGSKGDGLLKLKDYDTQKDIQDFNFIKYTTHNSNLCDNSVYCIVPSKKEILWIGTELGLNYYSYNSNQFYDLNIRYKGTPVKYIHDIYEKDDILWITTVGMGIFKAKIIWNRGAPILSIINQFVTNNGEMSSNYFYDIYPGKQSSIWLANRGAGVLSIDSKSSHVKVFKFDGFMTNEINTINQNNMGYLLVGTSLGLVIYDGNNSYRMGEIPNNVIHGIENSSNNASWLSTNRGIIYFDFTKKTFRLFNHLDGLDVIEYSDGASFKDKQTGTIFFGGINGFVTIDENDYHPQEHMPNIIFNKLKIQGIRQNINDFLTPQGDETKLTLTYIQNFFSISFIAIDYINGTNYSYSYKIEGINREWINLSNENTVTFSNLNPGEYTLLVKYHNRGINKESPIYKLTIAILPPWYLTEWAYFIYALSILTSISIFIYYLIQSSKKKQKRIINKINQEHKEKVYESKLDFFTNIAHEFGTPLTLIYGPCNRILKLKSVDNQVIKYTEIIEQNAERLKTLIQQLIDFRKIETGNRNAKIREINISNLSNQICHSFSDMADTQNIKLKISIPQDITWNTDEYFYSTILINLISNAFKYSYNDSEIIVNISQSEQVLVLRISNKGRGIKKKNMTKLFDRYTILNQFEKQENSNKTSRNGLGLAILSSMVDQLRGHIDIESTLNEWTHFTIILPKSIINSSIEKELELNNDNITTENLLKATRHHPITIPTKLKDNREQTIMVIDNEPEMLWFINDLFFEDYNVITQNSAVEALSKIKEMHPDIILCDVMMPQIDGIEFIKKIKENKQTAHIPFIFVTAKHNMDEQIAGINAGAELYITKPFNIDYLKSSVVQLLNRKKKLKDYYSSAVSAFTLEDGKLIHNDEKAFIQEILNIIDENIQDNKLSVQFISEKLNISTRTLYRRVKKAGDISVANLIRDSRLHIAKNLLLQTTMTIDEIVYKSGFNNRVSFYNAFSEMNNCTPSEYRVLKAK